MLPGSVVAAEESWGEVDSGEGGASPPQRSWSICMHCVTGTSYFAPKNAATNA